MAGSALKRLMAEYKRKLFSLWCDEDFFADRTKRAKLSCVVRNAYIVAKRYVVAVGDLQLDDEF